MYKMKYFSEKELKIENAPLTIKNSMYDLVENILDPLREEVGLIHVNSAYRTLEYNAMVGGAKNSQHTKGQAVDFIVPNQDLKKIYYFICCHYDFDQVIFEQSDTGAIWIHISFAKNKNRKESLVATKKNGAWDYERFSGII